MGIAELPELCKSQNLHKNQYLGINQYHKKRFNMCVCLQTVEKQEFYNPFPTLAFNL